MSQKKTKPINITLPPEAIQKLDEIQAYYGLLSRSAAIVFVIHDAFKTKFPDEKR